MAHLAADQPAAHRLSAAGDGGAAREAARKLFAREARFAAAAGSPQSLPRPSLPEIAFAGRSNVGKSSLINALLGRKALARTSRTPGRTQQINFFELDGRLILADLPGYGFADAPKTAIEAWNALVEAYLRGRETLRRTLVLVDARHGLKDTDRATMTMLDRSAAQYQLVLTKSDKLVPAALDEIRAALAGEAARHPAAHPDIMAVSAASGMGIAELRAALAQFARTRGEER